MIALALAARPALAIAGGLRTAPDVTVEPGATVQVLAQDQRRAVVAVQNGGRGALRFGDADVAADRGAQLAPGEALTLNTSAALHCHNPGGHAAAVMVLWLEM